MRSPTQTRKWSARGLTLASAAIVLVLLPDSFFGIVATQPWELTILRMLALLGICLLASLPWASRAHRDVQRRLRWWSIPGMASSAIYLISASPLYLFAGFCLLTGAAIDVWAARAHIASETLRARLAGNGRG